MLPINLSSCHSINYLTPERMRAYWIARRQTVTIINQSRHFSLVFNNDERDVTDRCLADVVLVSWLMTWTGCPCFALVAPIEPSIAVAGLVNNNNSICAPAVILSVAAGLLPEEAVFPRLGLGQWALQLGNAFLRFIKAYHYYYWRWRIVQLGARRSMRKLMSGHAWRLWGIVCVVCFLLLVTSLLHEDELSSMRRFLLLQPMGFCSDRFRKHAPPSAFHAQLPLKGFIRVP